jgi:hypothetical protein
MDFIREDYRQAGDDIIFDPYRLYLRWFYFLAARLWQLRAESRPTPVRSAL